MVRLLPLFTSELGAQNNVDKYTSPFPLAVVEAKATDATYNFNGNLRYTTVV